MTTTRSQAKTATAGAASAGLFNRREAAMLADVPLRTVDKAIEEKVVESRRSGRGTVLDHCDVLAIALIARTELPLKTRTKRRINEWVHGLRPEETVEGKQELSLSDVVVLRVDPEFGRLARRLYRYQDNRERYVETDPAVQDGEPVISGTRLPVRTVSTRLGRGDSIADLAEDYPGIPSAAFEAARLFAESHPRRGRPARPWRDE